MFLKYSRYLIIAGAVLLFLSLFIPAVSIVSPVQVDDEHTQYEARPTIYLLLLLPKLFYELLKTSENDGYVFERSIGFFFSLMTILACLWQVILLFFRKKIPIPIFSFIIFTLCLLNATISVSDWVGNKIPALQAGYYFLLLGLLATTTALGSISYDRIRLRLNRSGAR